MLHAVIMAGGAGTRFWPASRKALPKQMLRLLGERSMLQSTVDRLEGLIPPRRVLVVTNRRLVAAVARQLPELSVESILGEPARRDTAPCIGLAALHVSRDDPEAIMVVLPADHVVKPQAAFQQAIQQAAEMVQQRPSQIVTFGIVPTYPAESFGYIRRAAPLEPVTAEQTLPTYRVEQFREKPKADVAAEYLASGDYYWNSGIFVWKARTIIDALAQRQPQMLEHLRRISVARGKSDFEQVFQQEFTAIKGVSIDYAVMEHARDVAVIEAPFEWDDVGSWQALARLQTADDAGNTVAALHMGLKTTGTIVRGPEDHLIVTLGVSDLIVVHTPDATLVANRHDEESVREIVRHLEERGWNQYL